MEVKIEIKGGQPLDEQSNLFQAWYSENIQPKIDFGDSCNERDKFSRPKTWLFPEEKIRVEATYRTQDVNYTFNEFVIFIML